MKKSNTRNNRDSTMSKKQVRVAMNVVLIDSPANIMPGVLCSRPTGRDWYARFEIGIANAEHKYHDVWNRRLKGEGATAHYMCATDVTKRLVIHWLEHDKVEETKESLEYRLQQVRTDWLLFIQDCKLYVDKLSQVPIPKHQHVIVPGHSCCIDLPLRRTFHPGMLTAFVSTT